MLERIAFAMRSHCLRIVFGMNATPRGVTARAIEHALHVDGIELSRGARKALTARVLQALEQIGYRFG